MIVFYMDDLFFNTYNKKENLSFIINVVVKMIF